jgi:hypothetical protein
MVYITRDKVVFLPLRKLEAFGKVGVGLVKDQAIHLWSEVGIIADINLVMSILIGMMIKANL